MLSPESITNSSQAASLDIQNAKLGSLNNFNAKHQKFIKFLEKTDFGICQADAKMLATQMVSLHKKLEDVYKIEHQHLHEKLQQACDSHNLEAISNLFIEIKTRVVAENIIEKGNSWGSQCWSRDLRSNHFLYVYLELIRKNPNQEFKSIIFPLLHASALIGLKDEMIICLDFIIANEMMDALFEQGDCCFTFGEEPPFKLYFYRAVLTLLLPYFQALLTSGMKESASSEIHLGHNVNPMVMKELLGMWYGCKGDDCFQMDNLLLYLQEAARMNADGMIKIILKHFYSQLKKGDGLEASILIDLFKFAKEQQVKSLSLFVVYWVVFKIVHGEIKPTNEGSEAELLSILGDNITHIGNEQYEAMNNDLPSWLNFQTVAISDEQLLPLFQCFPKAISWDLRRYDQITDKAVEYLTTYCKEIKALNFYCSDLLTDKSLKFMAENLTKLEFLSLGSLLHKNPRFSTRGILLLLKGCPQLRRIALSDRQRALLFDSNFYNALKGLSLQLEHFETPGKYSFQISHKLDLNETLTLLQACPKLKILSVSFSKNYFNPGAEINQGKVIRAITKYCLFMEDLSLGMLGSTLNLTQEELQGLLNMPQLKKLTLYLAKREFDPDLLKKGPHLESLRISYKEDKYYSYRIKA